MAAKLILKRTVQLVFLLTAVLFAICSFRAVVYFPQPPPAEKCTASLDHQAITFENSPNVLKRFQKAIGFRTITKSIRQYDAQELVRFIDFIEKNYPTLHASSFVQRELIANYSLLYTIKGTDDSLQPYMVCAHLDVVPIEEDKWTVPPFSGFLRDGYVYGRGTMDVKDSLMGILEAMEHSLATGFRPRRTIYMAFGHDEEASGIEGAQAMAKVLEQRLGQDGLLYLLDEGALIVNSPFPGVSGLVAMVGIAEKGYLTVKITARGEAGHASLAPRETAIIKLGKVISRFTSDAHPLRFGQGPERGLFEGLAPYASFPLKLVYGNIWLFRTVLGHIVSLNPMGNALVRTTTAVTIINGGQKDNVLPSEASAHVNHRIHPVDTVASVASFDRQLIADDSVELNIVQLATEPHPVSPLGTFGYQAIKRSLRQVFDDVIVVPSIMVAATDTKWYLKLTKNIYRFTPVILRNASEAKMFHGHDERIAISNYYQIVNYYHHLFMLSDGDAISPDFIVKDEL
ncbi:N-fatty-acyl-amino acid synthase/hydrolase PM20D1.2 [Halotydeus destructor]|nr:N-fatty-acyl-amino acid synthase/hydrolase PM20D1.2 [Halotydeus destructor]